MRKKGTVCCNRSRIGEMDYSGVTALAIALVLLQVGLIATANSDVSEDKTSKGCIETCGNSTDVTCKDNDDKFDCECNDKQKKFDSEKKECKICDCGENGECSFKKEGLKTCTCNLNFIEKDGTCEDCECGEKATGCIFEGEGKVCKCEKGFAEDKGKCEALEQICDDQYTLCKETGGHCDVKEDGKILCICTAKKSYDDKMGCAVPNDTCTKDRPQCLDTKGTCDVNPQNQTVCVCPKEKAYVKEKGCTDIQQLCMDEKPMCLETQGSCNVTYDSKVLCICPAKKHYVKEKGCEVLKSICDKEKPSCRETNGNCSVTAESDVTCVCEKGKEYNESVGCAVNKCKTKCGFGSTLVLCEGDPFGEEEVTCKCKEHKMDFIQEKKICKYGKSLSAGSIAGIIISILAAIVLVSLYVLHRRRAAATAVDDYQASFRGETITFESALYNANYESFESNNSQ